MSVRKIFEKYTNEEIAHAFIIPAKLTLKQQKEADRELAEALKKSRLSLTDEQRLYGDLLQLRFQLETYLKQDHFDPTLTFGHFLNRYLKVINKKKKEFAEEIQIHETLLSHLINDRREPNENIMVRLELHSNNVIPAVYWYKLAEKEKEHHIKTDSAIRKRESQFISGRLPAFA